MSGCRGGAVPFAGAAEGIDAEHGLVQAGEDALEFSLTAEHGAGALKTAVHRQRRRIEAPALERVSSAALALICSLMRCSRRSWSVLKLYRPLGQPGLERRAQRVGPGFVHIHVGMAGLIDRDPFAGRGVNLVMHVEREHPARLGWRVFGGRTTTTPPSPAVSSSPGAA